MARISSLSSQATLVFTLEPNPIGLSLNIATFDCLNVSLFAKYLKHVDEFVKFHILYMRTDLFEPTEH
ncbi:hypothetical protein Hanom_Chr04g00342571 [Helianthus anomalus]